MTDKVAEAGTLEEEIRQVPGVLGAVVFSDRGGHPVEIQVFTRAGVSEQDVRKAIAEILARAGVAHTTERIFLFELAGEPSHRVAQPNLKGAVRLRPPEQPSAPARSGARRRPKIGRVHLAAGDPVTEVNVSLIYDGREAIGVGRSRKTPQALRVTAAATLEAAQALLGMKGVFALEGVAIIETRGELVVQVLVHSTIRGGRSLLGSAFVGSRPSHEAAVRASLDAINRQLELALS